MLVSSVTVAEVDLPGDPTVQLLGEHAVHATDWLAHQLAAIVSHAAPMHAWMTGEGFVIVTETRTDDAPTYAVEVGLHVDGTAPDDDSVSLAAAAAVLLRVQQLDISGDTVTLTTTALRAA
ncbi:hypothetical protein [Microbacterium sp. NPDC089696]|uniref:hypothetical protein n=1 Tax=Microbacterium sp. NPDC089696 TaxID=3364199 RepID=UPI0038190C36